MAELTDHELLTRFARTGEEAAFATLVTRHVNLVWSAARRFTGDDTLASEVTQAVFIILAQKAGRLSAKSVLTGWLYQTARLTAANALKENRRRQQREHQAYMEATLTPDETNEAWQQLAPVLDEAMHGLRTADRDAVLLRYFENKSLADVGAALGVTEDAARVRVNRALDKLRALLAKQGITFGAALLATAVVENSVQAAPTAIGKTITTVAVAKGAAATTSIAVIVNGTLKTMAWAKAKIVGFVFIVAAVLTGISVLSVDEYFQELGLSKTYIDDLKKAPEMFLIQETHFGGNFNLGRAFIGAKFIGRNQTLENVIRSAYSDTLTNEYLVIFPNNMPSTRYDFIVTVTNKPQARFQELIRKKFGYTAHYENITTNWYALKVSSSGAKLTRSYSYKESSKVGLGFMGSVNMNQLCETLQIYFSRTNPIINQTGVEGFYDYKFDWQWREDKSKTRDVLDEENFLSCCYALKDQFGLEIIPTNAPLKMLVVEHVR